MVGEGRGRQMFSQKHTIAIGAAVVCVITPTLAASSNSELDAFFEAAMFSEDQSKCAGKTMQKRVPEKVLSSFAASIKEAALLDRNSEEFDGFSDIERFKYLASLGNWTMKNLGSDALFLSRFQPQHAWMIELELAKKCSKHFDGVSVDEDSSTVWYDEQDGQTGTRLITN